MSQARITPDMQVLEVIHQYRSTEAVFKEYEAVAGACICCEALFETVEGAAEKYDLDLNRLLEDLNARAGAGEGPE